MQPAPMAEKTATLDPRMPSEDEDEELPLDPARLPWLLESMTQEMGRGDGGKGGGEREGSDDEEQREGERGVYRAWGVKTF